MQPKCCCLSMSPPAFLISNPCSGCVTLIAFLSMRTALPVRSGSPKLLERLPPALRTCGVCDDRDWSRGLRIGEARCRLATLPSGSLSRRAHRTESTPIGNSFRDLSQGPPDSYKIPIRFRPASSRILMQGVTPIRAINAQNSAPF